jgi:hypothetical protein
MHPFLFNPLFSPFRLLLCYFLPTNFPEEPKIKYFASIYNKPKSDFFSLPAEAQTVIASVSFQYGVNLNTAAPKFWKAASSQDWKGTVKIIEYYSSKIESN